MAASITYDEIKGLTLPSQFDLTYTVTASTEIPPEIFLYDATNVTVYLRVATTADFQFPTAADPLNYAFYRKNTVTFALADLEESESAQTAMRASIAALATAYQDGTDAWPGTDPITVP